MRVQIVRGHFGDEMLPDDDGRGVMGELEVAVDQLTDASVSARTIADHIEEGVRRFATDVDGLLTTWQGLSASSFSEPWTEWKEGADIVVCGLRTTAHLLAESAHGYADRESVTTDHIDRLSL